MTQLYYKLPPGQKTCAYVHSGLKIKQTCSGQPSTTTTHHNLKAKDTVVGNSVPNTILFTDTAMQRHYPVQDMDSKKEG